MSKRKLKLFSFVLIAAIGVFACGLLSGGEPTAVPVPPSPTPALAEPTQPPAEPTQPPPEPTQPPPEPTQDNTVQQNAITIDMVNGFIDNMDILTIVGLVTNRTDQDIDDVALEVEIFDADGNSLFIDTAYLNLFALAPGETSPFSLRIFEDLPSADNFEVTVVNNRVTELARAAVDVDNVIMTIDDYGDIHITGELFNNNDQPVVINGLAAAIFDAAGEIVTAESYTTAIGYLDPGESGPFRISITGPQSGTDSIADYALYLDAEYSEPVDVFNISISEAVNYLDAFESLHLVGEATNNGDVSLSVRLVAAVYDAEGNVLDASFYDAPFSLAPGETIPYDFDFWGPLNYSPALLDMADSYTIQVDGYWTWETGIQYVDLTTTNDTNEFDLWVEFTGEIVNNSGSTVEGAAIVIYLRDTSTGQVVGVGSDFVFEEMADGDSREYSVFINVPEDFDINSAEYFIIAKGELP